MKNLIKIFTLLFTQQVIACIPSPTTVDLDKAKESVSVETKKMVILISRDKIKLQKQDTFNLKPLNKESIFRMNDTDSRNQYYFQIKKYPLKTTLKLKIGNKNILLKLNIQKEDISFNNENISRSKSITLSGCGGVEKIHYE